VRFVEQGADIPNELIRAVTDGSATFLCGAGVSFRVGLPSFKTLTEQVYTRLGESSNEEAAERNAIASKEYDRALRSLEKRTHRPGTSSRVRDAVAERSSSAPSGALLCVNLHGLDLTAPHLYALESPLSRVAERIVLEVTERAALDRVDNLQARIGRLRELGFRIAVDDLGASHAGLSSFRQLGPDLVKLDLSLIRDVVCSEFSRCPGDCGHAFTTAPASTGRLTPVT